MPTLKKQRFQRARELRRLGFPFVLAKKVANDLLRNGYLTRTDLPDVKVHSQLDSCGCCLFETVEVSRGSKPPLVFYGRNNGDFR